MHHRGQQRTRTAGRPPDHAPVFRVGAHAEVRNDVRYNIFGDVIGGVTADSVHALGVVGERSAGVDEDQDRRIAVMRCREVVGRGLSQPDVGQSAGCPNSPPTISTAGSGCADSDVDSDVDSEANQAGGRYTNSLRCRKPDASSGIVTETIPALRHLVVPPSSMVVAIGLGGQRHVGGPVPQ